MLANPNLWRRKIFDFHNYLTEHGYSECYTQSACSMIRGFFFLLRSALTLWVVQVQEDWQRDAERQKITFSIKKTLVKWLWWGILEKDTFLLVGKSLGLRAGDLF